jgi:hypothetical protein
MSVKLISGNNRTISINPLLCKSFNADFDGDEMCIYGIDELSEKLPVKPNPIQDYIISENENISLNEVTFMGLTANKEGIKYIIDSGSKGKEFNFKYIYERIGDVYMDDKIIGQINGCYWNGISADDWYILCQATRKAAASIGVYTPLSGKINSEVIMKYI